MRVHSNGTPVTLNYRKGLFIGLLILLIAVNAMFGLFSAINDGCFHVLDLTISDEYISIFHGEDYQLSATTLTTGEGNMSFRWESDTPELVKVDQNGKITGLEVGKAVVTVTEERTGNQAICNVTVMALSEMSVDRTEFTLGVGEQDTISAFSGNGQKVEYTSSDPAVAQVDENGAIRAVSTGDVVITVSGFGCEKIPCNVSVRKAPSAITFDTSLNMCAGEVRNLSASVAEDEHCAGFTFSTSDSIIQLSEDGTTLTALSAGTAAITATTYNGVTATGTVNVREAPVSISAKLDDKTLYTGNTTQITPKENTGYCRQFTYSSSDPKVATVDKDGVVTATGKGTASISCETFNGVKTSCKVEVDIVDYTTPYTSRRVAMNCQDLVNKYPDLIKMEVIGQSTHGTDIILLKMGTGEKKALITGGIHSREDITVNFVMRCIEEYAEAFSSKSGRYGTFNLGRMLTEWTLYFVPAMNPDGIDIANDGLLPLYKNGAPLSEDELFDFKNTSTGVNLNRNFPFEWNGDEALNSTTPDIDSYIGKSEASEPETQAIIKLCEENTFEWLFSFHIKGNMLYWADSVNENAEKAEYMSNRLVVNCGFNLMRTSDIEGASGGMENWFRQQYNKPGFCIELIDDKYSSDVNKYFELKTVWYRTKYTIIYGMVYG